jgi:hypothetical protein
MKTMVRPGRVGSAASALAISITEAGPLPSSLAPLKMWPGVAVVADAQAIIVRGDQNVSIRWMGYRE